MREIDLPGGIEVQIQEQFQLENDAGAVVWDAALVLAYFLVHCQENSEVGHNISGKSVLEIGAGTGVVGIVAAMLGATPVMLTDLPHLVPFMDSNIQANGLKNTYARQLEWGNVQHIKDTLKCLATECSSLRGATNAGGKPAASDDVLLRMHPDVILCSDVIYQVKELDSLFFTLAMLSGSNTTVLLSHEHRDGTEGFHDVAKANGFVERRVPTDLLHPDWSSDDIHVYIMTKGTIAAR